MLVAFAVFHFDKDKGLPVFHDKVNFTKTAGEIPLQQFEALRAQIGFCCLFPVET